MVMVMVAMERYLPLKQFPQHLREYLQKVDTICFLECIRHIIGKGHCDILLGGCKGMGHLTGDMGLIRKYCGHRFAEFIPYRTIVTLVGNPDKFLHRFRIKGIQIGLVIIPGAFLRKLQICVPYLSPAVRTFFSFMLRRTYAFSV